MKRTRSRSLKEAQEPTRTEKDEQKEAREENAPSTKPSTTSSTSSRRSKPASPPQVTAERNVWSAQNSTPNAKISEDGRTVFKSTKSYKRDCAVLGAVPNPSSFKIKLVYFEKWLSHFSYGYTTIEKFNAFDPNANRDPSGYFLFATGLSYASEHYPYIKHSLPNIKEKGRKTGDVVEVKLDKEKKEISLVINGKLRGVAFKDVDTSQELFPVVVLSEQAPIVEFID